MFISLARWSELYLAAVSATIAVLCSNCTAKGEGETISAISSLDPKGHLMQKLCTSDALGNATQENASAVPC